MGLFDKIKHGFSKTKEELKKKLDDVVNSFLEISDEFFDELEEALIASDMGVSTVMDMMERLKARSEKENIKNPNQVIGLLKEEIQNTMRSEDEGNEDEKKILIVMGVNGVGKTTSIGKLANLYKAKGKKVMLVAADTFRAAAIDQLGVWADRVKVEMVKQKEGADPASVVFDGILAAKARGVDVLICDTAGRLHNKVNLMKELEKIMKIAKTNAEGYRIEVLLVLDATTGQNAVEQARSFSSVTQIDGIILTKLDSSAKGGIVVSIKKELNIPVRFVGVGEKIEDLEVFEEKMFAEAIFERVE